jgi:hypothetical protein
MQQEPPGGCLETLSRLFFGVVLVISSLLLLAFLI